MVCALESSRYQFIQINMLYFGLTLTCLTHGGCAGRMFLECAADGVFTTLPIKFIIKTELGTLYERRNRP